MFKIQTNPILNRVSVILSGRLDVLESQEALATLTRELNRMKPQFDIVCDFRHLRTTTAEASSLLPQAMDVISRAGVRRAVRVIGGSREGLIHFAAQSKDQNQYEFQYVRTLEEVEKVLA